MLNTLRVVLGQINPTVGDITGNLALILENIQHARDVLRADLIIFPELALTGYPPEDNLLRPDFVQRVEKALQQLIAATTGIAVIIGYPAYDNAHCYNALAFIENQQLIHMYYKQILPNIGVFDDKRYFTPGNTSLIIKWRGQLLGVLICEDIWHEEPIKPFIDTSIDALITINASPFEKDKAQRREVLLINIAKKIKAPVFYVNMVGGQDELVFDGGSQVIDAKGHVLARAPYFESSLLLVMNPNNKNDIAPDLSEEALIYQALVLSVRDYWRKNKCSGAIIGLSGGIDSALTLAIAVDALGAENIETVYMPTRYSANISAEESAAQALQLGVNYRVIAIDSLLDDYLKLFDALSQEDGLNDLSAQNIQARIRANILMALSNKTGKYVISTGNKSEIATGYCTLYGDMCGAFAVLKDVYKTMVYRLAHYRNGLSSQPIIPARVIERAPSAELAPNQRDDDSLPAYPILDALLERLIEQNHSLAQLIAEGYEEDLLNRILTLLQRSEYKRRQGVIGPKVTTCAFGRDWRFPLRGLSFKK